MFYHDIKEHASPSSLDQYHHQRSAFIKTYFEGDRGMETVQMAFGTQVHALIEHGMLKVQKRYDRQEDTLKFEVGEGLYVLGKPDSHQSKPVKNTVEFVDYKTGGKSEWDEKLPTDIKMKVTAWLVWKAAGMPAAVKCHIEFLQTTWNEEKRELELLSNETEITTVTYHKADLEAFGEFILTTMKDINEFYEKWKNRTTEFVNLEECVELKRLNDQKVEIEGKIAALRANIECQMTIGGLVSHKVDGVGRFSVTQRSTYKYPDGLRVTSGRRTFSLKDFAKMESATKAAKKNYELVNEPVSTSTSLIFSPEKTR